MKNNTKPIIGIISDVDVDFVSSVKNDYVKAIEASGGTPILLPYSKKSETSDSFIELCDGFLFSGGNDIEPIRYGEETKPNCGAIQLNRDDFEFRMFEKMIATDKPILAICRGMQVVNVAFGGTLYQDIPSEISTDIQHRQTEARYEFSHFVKILGDTPLAAFIGENSIRANSFHHQAVKRLGDGLLAMAYSTDGIIEGFYHTSHPYLRAYQWHPERLFDKDSDNKLIFSNFIAACKENA